MIKQKVKDAVNYVSDFEEKLVALAKANHCDGIICGHIHKPDIRQIDDITYMNSGDWVESKTALVEDYEGNWELFHYVNEYSFEVSDDDFEQMDDSQTMIIAKGFAMSIIS